MHREKFKSLTVPSVPLATPVPIPVRRAFIHLVQREGIVLKSEFKKLNIMRYLP